jgi:hypothetical protein
MHAIRCTGPGRPHKAAGIVMLRYYQAKIMLGCMHLHVVAHSHGKRASGLCWAVKGCFWLRGPVGVDWSCSGAVSANCEAVIDSLGSHDWGWQHFPRNNATT